MSYREWLRFLYVNPWWERGLSQLRHAKHHITNHEFEGCLDRLEIA